MICHIVLGQDALLKKHQAAFPWIWRKLLFRKLLLCVSMIVLGCQGGILHENIDVCWLGPASRNECLLV